LIADNNFLFAGNNAELSKTHCPYCKTGKLLIRHNSFNNNQFLGCSHYPGCNQTFNDIEILEKTILCPNCRSGFMTKRSGKFGNFLGCTNYPKCTNTINLQWQLTKPTVIEMRLHTQVWNFQNSLNVPDKLVVFQIKHFKRMHLFIEKVENFIPVFSVADADV